MSNNLEKNPKTEGKKEMIEQITEKEISQVQQAWGDGVVSLGQAQEQGASHEELVVLATKHVEKFYDYDNPETVVGFKPTLSTTVPFRRTKEGAISYFVGGDANENGSAEHDHGFALKPWTKVRFVNNAVNVIENIATAVGTYYFTDKNDNDTEVYYSFVYRKNEKGELKIIVHTSFLPYKK